MPSSVPLREGFRVERWGFLKELSALCFEGEGGVFLVGGCGMLRCCRRCGVDYWGWVLSSTGLCVSAMCAVSGLGCCRI